MYTITKEDIANFIYRVENDNITNALKNQYGKDQRNTILLTDLPFFSPIKQVLCTSRKREASATIFQCSEFPKKGDVTFNEVIK